jgi:hypothetical protein
VRRLALTLLLVLTFVGPAPADAGDAARPKVSTRVKRTLHDWRYRLPKRLRGHTDQVTRLFAEAFAPGRSDDPGPFGPRAEVLHKLIERLPAETVEALSRPDAPSASAVVAGFDIRRAPAPVRGQLRHSMRVLRRMVNKVAADGDPVMARLLAAEAIDAIEEILYGPIYPNEVPSGDHFRSKRLQLMRPPASSGRAAVLRSAQPGRVNIDEVVEAAAAQGIAPHEIAILDLRFESEWDARFVKKAGKRPAARVKVVQMPIVDRSVPTDEQIMDALRLMKDSGTRLVWLHCHGGVGRTGVMVAAMRIAFDGWSAERAIAEAEHHTMWRPIQQQGIREFAAKWRSGQLRL